MTKKIFITGAAGFIGFHLAKHLSRRGDKVLGFDNFNNYYPPLLKRMRTKELQRLGIEVIEGDICNFNHLSQCLEKFNPDILVHLAAQAGVRHSLHQPQEYIKANIEGFVNILEVCRQHPKMPLVYASSSSVYGRNQKVPFSISDRVDAPSSLYGATKRTNELIADTYHHLYQIPMTGLRFFTVYGPWGRPDMAYYSFTKAILNEQPIQVYNYGNVQRDFTYIDDIVAGITAAIDRRSTCEIFNLGNHKPVAVGEMIAILEKLLKKRAKKELLPMQKGDVVTTYADIELSQKELGFQPKVSLEEGLHNFVAWFLEKKIGEII